MTRNILLLRKLHRLYKSWGRSQNPRTSNFTTKYAIWFSEKSRLPKNRTSNRITKRLNSVKATLTFGSSWINTGNLLQIGPFLLYIMALPFDQTMIKATCLTISLRSYPLCRMSTYRFPHSLLKLIHGSPQYTSNCLISFMFLSVLIHPNPKVSSIYQTACLDYVTNR